MTISRRPIGALLHDEFRRGWWKFATALVAGFGTATVIYGAVPGAGALETQADRSLHFVLLWIMFVAAAAAALSAGGSPARMYLLPLSSGKITALALFPGMACVGLLYLIAASGLNVVFHTHWPLWGPAMFLAALLGVLKSLSLAVGPSHLRRLVCWSVAAITLESWLCRRYGGRSFLEPTTLWTGLTLAEFFTLSLLIVGTYFLTAHSIARTRRGDDPILGIVSGNRLSRVGCAHGSRFQWWAQPTLRRSHRAFSSPDRAQFWFEWRQKGLILPSAFLVFISLLLTGYFLDQFDRGTYELLHGCFGFGKGLGPIALLAGLVIGHLDPARANPECESFLATRPATNAALSGAVLKAAAASLLVTWGLWCLAMIGATVVLQIDQGPEPVLDLWTAHGKFSAALATLGFSYAGVVVGIFLAAAWVALSLAASLVLTGRQSLLIGFVTGGLAAFLLVLFLVERSIAGDTFLPAAAWHWLIGISSLAGTAWVWNVAHRRKQVDLANCFVALGGWFILCALGAGVYFLTGPLELSHLVMMTGLLALPVAPFAAAPLALARNRHR